MSTKRRGFGGTLVHWFLTFFRALVLRCPHCGRGPMFQSHFTIRKDCPECGIVYQPYAGDSLGVYAVSYFLSVVPAILATIAVGYYAQVGPYWWLATFAGVSSLIFFGLYPQMKALWVSMVYLATGLRKNL